MAGDLLVASFTDAWIETSDARLQRPQFLVASFTDAWIETTSPTPVEDEGNESHLLQMRGLKPHCIKRNPSQR